MIKVLFKNICSGAIVPHHNNLLKIYPDGAWGACSSPILVIFNASFAMMQIFFIYNFIFNIKLYRAQAEAVLGVDNLCICLGLRIEWPNKNSVVSMHLTGVLNYYKLLNVTLLMQISFLFMHCTNNQILKVSMRSFFLERGLSSATFLRASHVLKPSLYIGHNHINCLWVQQRSIFYVIAAQSQTTFKLV